MEATRSNELFVTHFRRSYAEYPDLPIWIVTEVISFGALSQMFSGMWNRDKKEVARRYGIQSGDLQSRMHHLVYVRNLCAHHSRLWDRVWAIKPSLPKGQHWQSPHLPARNRLFATLLILLHLMKRCPAISAFAGEWRDRVRSLMENPPSVRAGVGIY